MLWVKANGKKQTDRQRNALRVRYVRDDLAIDADALEVRVRPEKLVVVVQQHGRVVHRREADRGDADAADVPAVGAAGEDLRLHLQPELVQRVLERDPVDVGAVQLGRLHVRALLVVLELDAAARLPAPVQQLVLKLQMVDVDRQPNVEANRQLRRDHVFLHTALFGGEENKETHHNGVRSV